MSNKRRVLIVEENNTVPFDPRVWQEATTLRDAGWSVTVICPAATGVVLDQNTMRKPVKAEDLDDVTVYRFPLTSATGGLSGYLAEYLFAFIAIARLSWHVWRQNHFDIIHFCNPPDIFFPIGLFYRLLGARVVFDHHDLFPELIAWRYSGFAGRLLYILSRLTEYLTFHCANVVISTNQSYRQVAMGRGGVAEDRIVILRNGPKSDQFIPVESVPALKIGRAHV